MCVLSNSPLRILHLLTLDHFVLNHYLSMTNDHYIDSGLVCETSLTAKWFCDPKWGITSKLRSFTSATWNKERCGGKAIPDSKMSMINPINCNVFMSFELLHCYALKVLTFAVFRHELSRRNFADIFWMSLRHSLEILVGHWQERFQTMSGATFEFSHQLMQRSSGKCPHLVD